MAQELTQQSAGILVLCSFSVIEWSFLHVWRRIEFLNSLDVKFVVYGKAGLAKKCNHNIITGMDASKAFAHQTTSPNKICVEAIHYMLKRSLIVSKFSRYLLNMQ